MSPRRVQSSLEEGIREIVATTPAPLPTASGSDRKNYTEKLSHHISGLVAAELVHQGLPDVKVPTRGRDKQIMGGYGTKGVDVYLSDDKHGLLLSSGTKGILFDVRKNLKELYERMGIVLLEPGDPDSVDLAPSGVPEHLHLANYCQEMVRSFNGRNPFY